MIHVTDRQPQQVHALSVVLQLISCLSVVIVTRTSFLSSLVYENLRISLYQFQYFIDGIVTMPSLLM